MSNLVESTGSATFSTLSVPYIHPSSSQSSAIIFTTTPLTEEFVPATGAPFKRTASFAGFIDRNSECTDLVGLVIACIIFLLAQTVLISVWYYLYVKIKWQRRSLMAITSQRHKNPEPWNVSPHFPPSQAYGVFKPNPIPAHLAHHQFPHHLLLPATHQLQQHHNQQLSAQQQQYSSPIEVRTQFEPDQIYGHPATIYTGTVIRHRIGSRVSSRAGFATASRTLGSKRRSVMKRTIRGNLRKSGGFHYYPNVFPSPTKLITSDSQDESGKSRVYEMFTASSGHEEEEVSGQHVSNVVVRRDQKEDEKRRQVVSLDPGTRNNNRDSKRNLFYRM